ncbi:putative steroid-binding protein 3, partial [Tetrabaena socialis]
MAKTFTAEELLAYDGSDPSKPVYIAVRGDVYDVSASREFYGK